MGEPTTDLSDNGTWKHGRLCTSGTKVETHFDGFYSYLDISGLMKNCSDGCDKRSDCEHASLYQNEYTNRVICYLESGDCGDQIEHSSYSLYTKHSRPQIVYYQLSQETSQNNTDSVVVIILIPLGFLVVGALGL